MGSPASPPDYRKKHQAALANATDTSLRYRRENTTIGPINPPLSVARCPTSIFAFAKDACSMLFLFYVLLCNPLNPGHFSLAMIQPFCLFTRLRHSPALLPLAFFAMWLQITFATIHLASTARAATGASTQDAPFWMICTAGGLIKTSGSDTNKGSPQTASDCAICASSAVDLWHAAPFHISDTTAFQAIAKTSWQMIRDICIASLSPRAGSSRAPPASDTGI